MALPFLPGNSFDKNLGKTQFHKSHFFDYNADIPVFEGATKPGIGGQPLPSQSTGNKRSVYPDGLGTGQPAWVAFDRQVLRFYAYFQEAIQEKREEQYRIRNCVILFYLEDDSIQVNEKSLENSGIPQGTLIRRHRIPLPPPDDDKFYTVEHFNVGQQVQLYSKTFQITGCDSFTANFLRKLGVKIPVSMETPPDPYSQHRDKMLGAMQPHRPYEKLDTLRQFLDYDRNVLRFNCYWDDTNNMFGDFRELILHYFLADDTIEILEKVPPNSGRDSVTIFLRRAKLPKESPNIPQPGVQTKKTVLNVFGPTGHGGRYILDALKTGEVHTDYYHESNLAIGAVIRVWGRNMILCDCDDFTKEFYRTKYGIENFQPINFPQVTPRTDQPDFPPYNGFGSEEDSLASCLHLIPKPPRRDFAKFMDQDRNGLDSKVLRFVARVNTSKSSDLERVFIIFYYLSDDTIGIFEPPIRNSGIIGGKFLERGRISKPKASPSDPTVYYQAEDLYIGGEVIFNSFNFILVDADEYALRYMEANADQFPHANINLILAKLRGPATVHVDQIKKSFNDADVARSGYVPDDQFRTLVKILSQGLLNDHEVLTLSRQYREKKQPPLISLIRLVQADLKKKNFSQFSKLLEVLQITDTTQCGFIHKEELQHVCHSVGLPLSDQLVEASMENCEKDNAGCIKYSQFVEFLNWVDHPASQVKIKAAAGSTGTWLASRNEQDIVTKVNYKALIEDLTTIGD